MTTPAPRPSRALALLTMVAVVALDQASKGMARALLEDGRRRSFLGDLFRLELIHNAGAFLSLGESLPPAVRSAILTWGVLALSAGAAWVALFRRGRRAASLGAALVAGGGLGNLWDRLTQHGLVTDFMNLGIGPVRTGIFNVADLAIVAGLAVLLLPVARADT